jgi:hypothetical protein
MATAIDGLGPRLPVGVCQMTVNLDELERLAKAAPAGDWEVWTSNSWRRVMASHAGKVEIVIEPCVQRHDNHPDLMMGMGVKEWLEDITPATILELVAEVRRLRNLLAIRPALNSGLIEAYSQWTAVVYESEATSKEKS